MWTVDEVMSEIEKDVQFYESSGGGVTFSGGECMLQVNFLKSLLEKCRDLGIRTAVDTAGNVPFDAFEQIIVCCFHTFYYAYMPAIHLTYACCKGNGIACVAF